MDIERYINTNYLIKYHSTWSSVPKIIVSYRSFNCREYYLVQPRFMVVLTKGGRVISNLLSEQGYLFSSNVFWSR